MKRLLENRTKLFVIITLFCLVDNISVSGQIINKILLQAGYVIGGTTPMPLPAEIRNISSYDHGTHFSVGAFIQGSINEDFDIRSGIRLQKNGMSTIANVKSYSMDMSQSDGNRMIGYYTGIVETNVENTVLTIPFLLSYQTDGNFNFVFGPFCQINLSRSFSGMVYDGYMRVDDGQMAGSTPTGPTGQKVEITAQAPAYYDFSENLNQFQYGLEFGTEWNFKDNYSLFFNIDWGMRDIFSRDFKVITFKMFPIYATLGISYGF